MGGSCGRALKASTWWRSTSGEQRSLRNNAVSFVVFKQKMYLYIGISTYESERTLDLMIEPTFNHPISGGQEPH